MAGGRKAETPHAPDSPRSTIAYPWRSGGFGPNSAFIILHSAFPPWWLWGRIDVALPGRSRFEIQGSTFTISLPNPTLLSRLPRSGLGVPWTCPATVEPPQTPIFDQPDLFRPLRPPLRRLSPAHAIALGDRARLGRSRPAPSPGGRGMLGVAKRCAVLTIPKGGWRGRQSRHPRRARSVAIYTQLQLGVDRVRGTSIV